MPTNRCLICCVIGVVIGTVTSSNAFVDSRCSGYSRLCAVSFRLAGARSNYSQPAAVERRSYSSELDSAYEWLARDRFINGPTKHGEIRWFNPNTVNSNSDTDLGNVDIQRMPMYPLGAVHTPHSGENYTIINIEPKNVKMALDLLNGKWNSTLFCATLRASDTNRIASVGTIMQIIDTDDLYGCKLKSGECKNEMPALTRVVAICRAVGVADILSIDNDCVYNKDDDYLIANVIVRHDESENEYDDQLYSIVEQMIDDYMAVRSIYIDSQSLASNELPPFARGAVQTLPTFVVGDVIHNETKFWKLVETWQMLCNTIRQSKRSKLQSIVNELSVTVAMQAEGPLELPVKRKSLPLNVQRHLEEIEHSASQDWIELGMDPILDFQEILTMRAHIDRVAKLATMIQRERSRLEAKESLIRAFLGDGGGDDTFFTDYSKKFE